MEEEVETAHVRDHLLLQDSFEHVEPDHRKENRGHIRHHAPRVLLRNRDVHQIEEHQRADQHAEERNLRSTYLNQLTHDRGKVGGGRGLILY